MIDSEKLRTSRGILGLSQQGAAALLGVSFATYNRWENEKRNPQPDRRRRIEAFIQTAEKVEGNPSEKIKKLHEEFRREYESDLAFLTKGR